MSRGIFTTDEGLRVVYDPQRDYKVYNAPCNPPSSGSNYFDGTNLYMHRTRKGKEFFYTLSWSLWQGVPDNITFITKDEAKEFFIEKMSHTGHVYPYKDEIEDAKKLWPDLELETA